MTGRLQHPDAIRAEQYCAVAVYRMGDRLRFGVSFRPIARTRRAEAKTAEEKLAQLQAVV
jgi:hypothetical protein